MNRNKGYCGEQISRKIVSRELNARSYHDFAKNIALLGATSAKFAKSVGKKMGSNMRPRYIQFRDIHDRDISGLHCTIYVFPPQVTLAQSSVSRVNVCSVKWPAWNMIITPSRSYLDSHSYRSPQHSPSQRHSRRWQTVRVSSTVRRQTFMQERGRKMSTR